MKVGIDNGHGLNVPGKRSPCGTLREWQFNYATAKYLKEELKRCKIDYVMLSDTEADTSLSDRVKKCKRENCDLLVSIHANAYKGTEFGTWGGTETYAYKKGGTGDKYAQNIQAEMVKTSKLRDRGVKYDSLYIVRESHCPAVLVEAAFMDNKQELNLLKSESFRKQTAKAIAKGICKTANIKYIEETTNDSNTSDDILYRVIAGSFKDKSNAERQLNKLKELGISGVFLEARRG